jgi:hypothetical protein
MAGDAPEPVIEIKMKFRIPRGFFQRRVAGFCLARSKALASGLKIWIR